MCSSVLVVVDNVPLVHPRPMHNSIESIICVLPIILRHGVLTAVAHLLCLQLAPVYRSPALPVRLIVWFTLFGEHNTLLETKESIGQVWALPSEIQGPSYA